MGTAAATWTTDRRFAAVETAYADYQRAWGAWMVGHHRGAPVGATVGGEAGLARRLVAARARLGRRLAALDRARLATANRAALDVLLGALPDLDGWPAPLDGRRFADAAIGPSGDVQPGRGPAAEDPAIAALRRSTFAAWGAAMARLDAGGEPLDRLTVFARLATEPDVAQRRRLFTAMAPAWAVLDGPGGSDDPTGPYRRLVRSSAEQWRRAGSPVAANAAALGLDPETVESTLRSMVRTYRDAALPRTLVEPWDYDYLTKGLARRLDPLVPLDRLREINDAHLASIGAEPRRLRVAYDIEPRPGRPVIPTAFTVSLDIAERRGNGRWRAARPWVFATYATGGLGNLEELLHESGHALHYAALRSRPATFAWPGDQTAFVEAVADVVGWSAHEPAFLAQHTGAQVTRQEAMATRYANVVVGACWTLFELELHRHPDRRPNEVWSEIMEGDLGLVGHPEWSWWAQVGQLIDGPGYIANYALGAIVVAAVRARIRELRGDWATGDPGWYRFIARRLLRFAGGRTPRSVLEDLLGTSVTAGPVLAEIEGAA